MKKLSKILTWVAIAVGVVSFILMGMMWNYGDDVMSASVDAQAATIDPMFAITWILFGIAAAAIVFFVVKTWIQSPKTLLKVLPNLIIFVAALVVAYLLADNTPTLLSNGKYSTESDSLLADFGIWATYILGAIAALTIVFGGFLKSLKKK